MSFRVNIKHKTTEELLSIYNNAEEYQDSFILLVVAELQKRNVDISEYQEKIADKERQSDNRILKVEKGDPVYLGLAFVSALFGGMLAIAAGTVYSFSKRMDSKGQKHYYYDLETRKKGHKILFIGLIVFLGILFYKLGI